MFDRTTTWLLSRLGLDFSCDLRDEPFHRITQTLTLGSRPRPEQLDRLRADGITHVVSCLPDGEQPTVGFLSNDFETLFLPVHDGMLEDIAASFPTFFAFIEQAGRDARVLVHCQVGVSRSATLVVAHLMRTRRLRFYEAYQEVRSHRVQVLPNVGFASQLQGLEDTLFPTAQRQKYASLTRYLHEVCNVPVELELLQEVLEHHGFDAVRALRTLFDGDIPRVVQGVRR